jgi:hypothetical protein
LYLLVSALPPDALFRHELEAAKKRAQIPTVDQIRARAEHYKRQREKAVTDG